jgi:hypothetical protein
VYFTGFARSKNPPVIDANVGDDEWDKDILFRLQYESQVKNIPDWTGPLDVGGKVYSQWDNDNLYIAAEIDDDVHFVKVVRVHIHGIASVAKNARQL